MRSVDGFWGGGACIHAWGISVRRPPPNPNSLYACVWCVIHDIYTHQIPFVTTVVDIASLGSGVSINPLETYAGLMP